jgi:hypothetical protein
VVEARIRTLQVIVAALATGVFTYTTVAVGLISTGALGTGGVTLGTAAPGAVALGVALLFALAPVVRRRVLHAGPAADGDQILARWFSASLVAMALREGAGLLGITVSLLAGSVPWVLGFGLASVAAMGLAWPRGDEVRDRVRRAGG